MLVLENGSGVQGANSAISSDFVTLYLTMLNRQDQNGWNADTTTDAIRQAACIAATQYVEKRWGDKFIGEKLYVWEEVKATAQIQINGVAHKDSSPGIDEVKATATLTYHYINGENGIPENNPRTGGIILNEVFYGFDTEQVSGLSPSEIVLRQASFITDAINSGNYDGSASFIHAPAPAETDSSGNEFIPNGFVVVTISSNKDGIDGNTDTIEPKDIVDDWLGNIVTVSPTFSGGINHDHQGEQTIGSDQYIEIGGKKISFSDDALNPTAEAVNLLMKLKANEITAELDKTDNTTIIVTSNSYGVMGNYDMPITQGNHAGLTPDEEIPLNITQWAGGLHGGEQQTSYPREDWSEPMPLIYLNALAEYAIRSLADGLIPDPEVDPSGRVVIEKKERVGAIEEQTKYAVGTSLTQQFKPYPEADILLRPLLRGGQGRVYR